MRNRKELTSIPIIRENEIFELRLLMEILLDIRDQNEKIISNLDKLIKK